MKSNLPDKLQEVFRKVFADPSLSISGQTSAEDIPGWDSFTHMTLMAEVEETFGITFSYEEVSSFRNAGDLLNTIAAKIK
jgi:acyl carrier protein